MRRLLLLVLATGLLGLASGQANGLSPAPIQTPPDAAFHPVTDDLSPTQSPAPLVDDFVQPTPLPRPSIDLPPAIAVAVSKPTPTPRPLPAATPAPKGYPTVADAKAYALGALGSTQYSCLNEIAIHESNWNPHDLNASSGAYGIPQALPGSKMSTAGADWHDNPVTQVRWMIGYVDGVYGSACAAWSHWQSQHWY